MMFTLEDIISIEPLKFLIDFLTSANYFGLELEQALTLTALFMCQNEKLADKVAGKEVTTYKDDF